MNFPKFTTITTTLQQNYLSIALNRPEKRNAINQEMMTELQTVFSDLILQEEIKFVILSGKGSSFCSGADLNELSQIRKLAPQEEQEWSLSFGKLLATIDECPKPLLLIVNGAVMGGGMGLLSVADIVIAAEEVEFGFPEVHLGLAPALISHFVMKKIGLSLCKRLMLTGEHFSVLQAKEWGFVDDFAKKEVLDPLVVKYITLLQKGAPKALIECKKLLQFIATHSVDENLTHAAQLLTQLSQSEEAYEGLSSFLMKTQPSWIP